MPVSKLQSELLRLLASRRDPASFVAGPRISRDIDIFHDREERVAATALEDAQILSDAGYTVRWLRQQPAIYSAAVASTTEETKLEWWPIAISGFSRR